MMLLVTSLNQVTRCHSGEVIFKKLGKRPAEERFTARLTTQAVLVIERWCKGSGDKSERLLNKKPRGCLSQASASCLLLNFFRNKAAGFLARC